MVKSMRQSTLATLGLGSVLDIFRRGSLPANTGELVDEVFGKAHDRRALVISGANGIVGAGKTMQLGSRLLPFGIQIVGLDFPGAPDNMGRQYAGLASAFGNETANKIMENIVRMSYNGTQLPPTLKSFRPGFLLEAIPEILEIKKNHYRIFRNAFPDIAIRSVTSGFPQSELGVGIAHPAFPHEINKIWEIVEDEPSSITKLFWALGLIPLPVADNWSFILDVLFCGITLASLNYHEATNMPFWKIDKYTRKLLGPNPLRAHDAIGAAGANFLTWSCLHHLSLKYGDLFMPAQVLEQRKQTGQNWYPMNHFRPLVNWVMSEENETVFENWILGPMYQMTSLMLYEKRAHLTHMNTIGELCAQFRKGILAYIRSAGINDVIKRVESYHMLHPEASKSPWYPHVFESMDQNDWQQLYVNAEHDGTVGVITICRESYNSDVDMELNRAIDWLKNQGIHRVIVTGDFHISTQMIGADTSEFFPALNDAEKGMQVSRTWSMSARRLNDEFKVSVGFVSGKRCLGGFLELLAHCHYLVCVDSSELGLPEVTLPVVPGMEGCHWLFRKSSRENWKKIMELLLTGRPKKAKDTVGWLADFAGPLEDAIKCSWKLALEGASGISKRELETAALKNIPDVPPEITVSGSQPQEIARKAIIESIKNSCGAALSEALSIQTKHSAEFMLSKYCRNGRIGSEFTKSMSV